MAAALAAFLIWGSSALYFRLFADLPAMEVLAHRVMWSLVLCGALLGPLGQGTAALRLLGDRRRLAPFLLSAVMIAINWLGFIWAVGHGRALEASMGYYLYPLVTVALGALVLGERLSGRQMAAVLVVAAGVGWLVASAGMLPWIALTLACSFGLYSLVRKMVPVHPVLGLFVEVLVVTPPAVAWVVWTSGGLGAFGRDWHTSLLLLAAGPLTTVPLLLFAMAARRLRLSTLGLMQYLNPTVQMLVAVAALGEPFTPAHLVAFAAIWAGLALYSLPLGAARGRAGRGRETER